MFEATCGREYTSSRTFTSNLAGTITMGVLPYSLLLSAFSPSPYSTAILAAVLA